MNTTPCAKLMMRMMPKMRVRPQAMKNRIAACDRAPRHCARMKPAKLMRPSPGGRSRRRPPGTRPSCAVAGAAAVRRDHLARIDLDDLGDRLRPLVGLGHLDHEALVLALVVALAHQDRALDAG